jgi:hypothetical protein
MKGLALHSDVTYQADLRDAEKAFLRVKTEWLKLLTKEIGRLPRPNTDESALAAQAAAEVAAMMRAEPLIVVSRPPASPKLISKLTKACREFAAAVVKSYAELLCRKGIPYSTTLNLLERHATVTLEEIRRRKWEPAIQHIAEVFECEDSAKDTWGVIIERFTWLVVRDIIEVEILFKQSPSCPKSPHSGGAEITAATSPDRGGGVPPGGAEALPAAEFGAVDDARRTRAQTVAKLIRELDILKPQMLEDEPEYSRLKDQYPGFQTFLFVKARPDLKQKVLCLRASTRHIRLAQELAAAHYGKQLSTIQDDWKHHKPPEFRRPRSQPKSVPAPLPPISPQ